LPFSVLDDPARAYHTYVAESADVLGCTAKHPDTGPADALVVFACADRHGMSSRPGKIVWCGAPPSS